MVIVINSRNGRLRRPTLVNGHVMRGIAMKVVLILRENLLGGIELTLNITFRAEKSYRLLRFVLKMKTLYD